MNAVLRRAGSVLVVVVVVALVATVFRAPVATAQSSSSGPPAHPASEGLRRARACGSDNACVVRALEGHARTCAEFGLLAVTYRWMHRDGDARAIFERYLRRCGPRDEVPRPPASEAAATASRPTN